MTCPNCESTRPPKNKGLRSGRHRFLCRDCDTYWTAERTTEAVIHVDKKEGIFDWREWSLHLQQRVELEHKASSSQKEGTVEIPNLWPCAVIKSLADDHFGSLGRDYATLIDFTDQFLKIPNLYACKLGDDTDNFAGFKSVMPVLRQGLTPSQQDDFLEQWLSEIAHKVLFSCWGNHAEFEERQTGRNSVKKILSKYGIYFDGIGIANVRFGDQTYRFCVTHKTRWHSSLNLLHGLKQLCRYDVQDAEVYLAGDKHVKGYELAEVGGAPRHFFLVGTPKTHDSYAERYFSYFASNDDGAFTIERDRHRIKFHETLAEALEYAQMVNSMA